MAEPIPLLGTYIDMFIMMEVILRTVGGYPYSYGRGWRGGGGRGGSVACLIL